jgi:hypothetical protein
MAWGFMCGEGWYPLIYEVLDGLQAIIDKNDNLNDVQVTEVKEKFGGLRIYLNYGTDEMFKIIENAEGRSYAVCEICGKPGKLHNVNGWLMTRCEECLESEDE